MRNKQQLVWATGAFALLPTAYLLLSVLSDDSGSMMQYHLKNAVSRTVLGDYRHERRRAEKMRRESLEALKNHPDRDAFLKSNPHLRRKR